MSYFGNGTYKGWKKFMPRPQNSILVPLRGSFQNFRRAPPTFYMEYLPPPPPGGAYPPFENERRG